MPITTLTSRGQTIIPKSIREALQLRPGDRVEFILEGDQAVLRRAGADLEERVTTAGGAYVDGAVLGYPSAVGTEELLILYSGDRETFAATRPLLEDLGGTATYVGEDAGTASVLEMTAFGPAMLTAAGIWQGAKICEIEGVPFETFAELVKGVVPAVAENSLRKAADPDFATNPEKIEGTVKQMADGTAHAAEYFQEVGVDPGVVEALQRIYQAGVEEGREEHDMYCVAELHADHPEPAA
jgi:AbrB family looped-hinge helix DNA binding protein